MRRSGTRPKELVEATRWDSPVNVENRDYLQVEKDAWAARRRIGDIPVTVISNEYSAEEIAAAEFPEEAAGMRRECPGAARLAGAQPARRAARGAHGPRGRGGRPRAGAHAILDVVEAARQPRIEQTTRIVFKRLDASAGGTLIYSVSPDGSQTSQLFDEVAEGPRWSPDGTEIAIFCCDDGMAAHILDARTGELRALPQPDAGLDAYCGGPWSPDGERLTCESFGTKDPGRNGIYSIRVV